MRAASAIGQARLCLGRCVARGVPCSEGNPTPSRSWHVTESGDGMW